MMYKVIPAALVALALAACAQTPEQIAAAQHAQCVEYGYTPGTDQYGQCRLALVALEQQKQAAAQAGLAAATANMNTFYAIKRAGNAAPVGTVGNPLYVRPCQQGQLVYC